MISKVASVTKPVAYNAVRERRGEPDSPAAVWI